MLTAFESLFEKLAILYVVNLSTASASYTVVDSAEHSATRVVLILMLIGSHTGCH